MNRVGVMILRTATDKQQGNPEPDSGQIKLCTVWRHQKDTIYSETQA